MKVSSLVILYGDFRANRRGVIVKRFINNKAPLRGGEGLEI
jgi:hypothetical protein